MITESVIIFSISQTVILLPSAKETASPWKMLRITRVTFCFFPMGADLAKHGNCALPLPQSHRDTVRLNKKWTKTFKKGTHRNVSLSQFAVGVQCK